jgi:hypothetical protein
MARKVSKRRQRNRRRAGNAIARGVGARIKEGGFLARAQRNASARQAARQERRQTRVEGRVDRRGTRTRGRVKRKQTRMDAKAQGTGKWSAEAIAGRQQLLGKTLGAAGAAVSAVGSLIPGGAGDALEGVGGAFGDAFGGGDQAAPMGDYQPEETGPNWMLYGGIAAAVVLVLVLVLVSMGGKRRR